MSILVPGARAAPPEAREEPAFFHDLALARVVAAITAGREEYDLVPFFHAPLGDADAVAFRQEVMHDLENEALRRAVSSFAGRMRSVRAQLSTSDKCRYELEKQAWHLAAAEAYVEAVEGLARDIAPLDLASRGLRAFREELGATARAVGFRGLAEETREVAAAFAEVRYSLHIRDGSVTVRRYEGEEDYSAAVEEAFERFRRGDVKDYRCTFRDEPGMNHVEAAVLERVALLFPEPFAALARFRAARAEFRDPEVVRFDREVQFHVAYLEWVERLRRTGLSFCRPRVVTRQKDVRARDTFDVALAGELAAKGGKAVGNDVELSGSERILVVTGPNQGGKTTFARTFGQIHYLAALGCLVPGREARLFLFDRILTHFEREESIANSHGKLEDDLVRIRAVLDEATPRSIVIINEIFASTTLEDALLLGRRVLERIAELDLLCVCVTFLDELASLGEKTVSAVAGVEAEHVDGFLRALRAELAFCVGALNLHERLAALGAPTCFPTPHPAGTRRLRCRELYDPCLALRMGRRAVGSSADTDGKDAVVVTGANQGGKSTFLRGLGVAQSMMQSGLFVAAEAFEGELCAALVTHYEREEDAALRSGKLDEELGRMSEIADHLAPNAMVLFNESFAATNEREGSEIARQIVSALLERRVKVLFVTHLHAFARELFTHAAGRVLFLRAERLPDGTRTFRLAEGEPLSTSHGKDVYERVFGQAAGPL